MEVMADLGIELHIRGRLPSDRSVTHEMKPKFCVISLPDKRCKQNEQVNNKHGYNGNFGKVTERKIIAFFFHGLYLCY